MIPQKQLDIVKEELDSCERPVFFFHDDEDGLCSFLLLYRYAKKGKGIVAKTTPRLTRDIFSKKVEDYGADKVFILDMPIVEEDFFSAVKVPIIWIDHHEPVKVPEGVKYFNPRVHDKNEYSPVTYWCYKIVNQDIWIATVGCLGDAYYPEFMEDFKKQYPGYADIDTKSLHDLLYTTKLGSLVRIFAFILKGATKEVMNSVKILTRLEHPDEILQQNTSAGRYVYKHFSRINKVYESILAEAQKVKPDNNMYLFIYQDPRMSITKDLANELSHKMPDKMIIIGREKNGELKLSLRWNKNINPVLEKALEGVDGYGGGHKYACGAAVKKHDFEKFMMQLKANM